MFSPPLFRRYAQTVSVVVLVLHAGQVATVAVGTQILTTPPTAFVKLLPPMSTTHRLVIIFELITVADAVVPSP